jgi:hypothetical protein
MEESIPFSMDGPVDSGNAIIWFLEWSRQRCVFYQL